MNPMLINGAVSAVLASIPPELLKSALDSMLDVIEDAVMATENKYDDATVLPAIGLVRRVLDIPDGED